ncbi:MAG: hypothetical protein AAF483_09775, partial [Planctomycetota bacterium]
MDANDLYDNSGCLEQDHRKKVLFGLTDQNECKADEVSADLRKELLAQRHAYVQQQHATKKAKDGVLPRMGRKWKRRTLLGGLFAAGFAITFRRFSLASARNGRAQSDYADSQLGHAFDLFCEDAVVVNEGVERAQESLPDKPFWSFSSSDWEHVAAFSNTALALSCAKRD